MTELTQTHIDVGEAPSESGAAAEGVVFDRSKHLARLVFNCERGFFFLCCPVSTWPPPKQDTDFFESTDFSIFLI